MATINFEAIRNLELTSNQTGYIESVTILLKLLDNVIREPTNEKYRTIRLENKIIKEKLLALSGMKFLLENIGFVEKNGALNLSADVLIGHLKKYRKSIADRLNCIQSNGKPSNQIEVIAKSSSDESKPGPSSSPRLKRIIPSRPFHERVRFDKVVPFQNNYLQELEHLSDQVMQYEDDRLQYYGRKLIPLETLTNNAQNAMRRVQKQELKDPCFRDWLLVELVRWFNEKFFTWVDTLPCKVCANESDRARAIRIEDGVRVEVSNCCGTETKFPRFNDVARLLVTRKGRCGEFANCFTFLCRCLDFDARLVHANFDHVWTEVFSVAQKRWIHVDPSDNIVDAPLMYQHGWKRDVVYVMAFSRDDFQDVTWKYHGDHQKLLSNRKNCKEIELLKAILLIREKRQQNCSAIRKKYLKKRALVELMEMLVPRQPTENEKRGRSSGSLSWKLARGEMQSSNNFYVFTPLSQEIINRQFILRYSCKLDAYERLVEDKTTGAITIIEKSKSWQSYAYRWEDVFRKEERDWKMVYLAREEDSERSVIEWKFDFSTNKLKIQDISVKFQTATYENGVIDLQFIHNGKVLPSIDNIKERDLTTFSVRATLSGGKGDCAWQHTQLFRQSMNDNQEYPFELRITFY